MNRYQASRRRVALLSGAQALLLAIALVATAMPGAAIAETSTAVTLPTPPTAPTSPTAPTAPTPPTGTASGTTTGFGGIVLPTPPTLPTCPTVPTLPTLPDGTTLPQLVPFVTCLPPGIGGGDTGGSGGSGGGGTGTPGFIHIRKYVRDNVRTAPLSMATTSVVTFPFQASVTGTTTTTFNLGTNEVNVNAAAFVNGISYSAQEVNAQMASSSAVLAPGSACVAGHWRTVGYHAGSTLSGAEAAPLSATPPSFTNLSGDQYLVIVNEYCTVNDMPPTTGGGTGGTGNGGGTATSTHATSTVVVHYSDLAQSSTDSAGKWFFWNGGTGAIDPSVPASAFVTGPGTPPLGAGSVMLTASDTMSHSIATNQFAGTRLSAISALSFASYIPGISTTTFPVGSTTAATTTTTGPLLAPFLAFNVNLPGTTGSSTGELVYQPGHNGTVATDTWQTWNTGGTGLWTWSGFATTTGTTTAPTWPDGNGSQYRSWNTIVSAFPNATIASMFGLGLENPSATTTATSTIRTAFLDNLSFTVATSSSASSTTITNATTTTFDFEPGTGTTASSGGGGSSSGGGGGGGGGGGSSSSSSSGGGGGGQVLGASCPLITSWMREGQYNDPNQVNVLQNFLNGEMTSHLAVSGTFDSLTTSSVNDFQVKYWQDVLAPWVAYGLPTDHTPTGYVYKTTSTKINRIACPGMTFPNPVLP